MEEAMEDVMATLGWAWLGCGAPGMQAIQEQPPSNTCLHRLVVSLLNILVQVEPPPAYVPLGAPPSGHVASAPSWWHREVWHRMPPEDQFWEWVSRAELVLTMGERKRAGRAPGIFLDPCPTNGVLGGALRGRT